MSVTASSIDDLLTSPYVGQYLFEHWQDETEWAREGLIKYGDDDLQEQVEGEDATFTVRLSEYEHFKSQRVTDDETQKPLYNEFGTRAYEGRKHFRSTAFKQRNFLKIMGKFNPLKGFGRYITKYWGPETQRLSSLCLLGIYLKCLSDPALRAAYIKSYAEKDPDSYTIGDEAKVINAEKIVRAIMSMGTRSRDLTHMIVHSDVYETILVQRTTQNAGEAKDKGEIDQYMRRKIIATDDDWFKRPLLDINGDPVPDKYYYVTVLLQPGFFRFAPHRESPGRHAWADKAAGRGGGMEYLLDVLFFGLMPTGFEYNTSIIPAEEVASVKERTLSDAQLASADLWRSIYTDRRKTPIVFLETNG